MKAEGRGSTSPLRDSLMRWENLRLVLRALIGVCAGQGVVTYAAIFYTLFFLTATLKVDYTTAYLLVAFATTIGAVLVVVLGRLSDRLGRKKLMLAGFLLSALTLQPIFRELTHCANPALESAIARAPVVLRTPDYKDSVWLVADILVDAARKIVLPSVAVTTTEKARNFLNARGIPFTLSQARPGSPLALSVGATTVPGYDEADYESALREAAYPKDADPAAINKTGVTALLIVLLAYAAMIYGPLAAFLVELFPTQVRYTSMSLPYHIGNGWFGGFMPLVSASIVVYTGNIYAGLWYPVGFAAFTCIAGWILLPETKDYDLSR